MEKFKVLRCAWNKFSKQCQPPGQLATCLFAKCSKDRTHREGTPAESIRETGLEAESLCSRTRYEVGDKTAMVFLNCNNLIIGKPGSTKTMLGGADSAAMQRMTRVGIMALRDENTLRWSDG